MMLLGCAYNRWALHQMILLGLLHTGRPIFSAAFSRIKFRLYLYVSTPVREWLPVMDGG
jgi:hypothetical protein